VSERERERERESVCVCVRNIEIAKLACRYNRGIFYVLIIEEKNMNKNYTEQRHCPICTGKEKIPTTSDLTTVLTEQQGTHIYIRTQ
jgi:hypothetical protein